MGREEPMEGWFHHGADLEWNGRELVRYRSFTGDEDFSETTQSIIEFTYNADGIRTSKTVNGVEHRYYLSGSLILGETWTENGVEHTVVYIYDESSTPVGIQYRNSTYTVYKFDSFFFEKNLQGDVIAIYNEFGEQIGAYFYDAWGNHTTYAFTTNTALENSILNTYNPFRYRSYFYDVETGFYYLQSRYYNPVWGRFINPDDIAYLGANKDLQAFNLYAYCSNNPVSYNDETGEFIRSLIGGLIGFAGGIIDQIVNKDWSLEGFAKTGISTIEGIATATVGPAAGVIISGVAAGISSAIDGNDKNQVLADAAISAGISVVSNGAQLAVGRATAGNFVKKASKTQLKKFANYLGYTGRNFKNPSLWGGKIMYDASSHFTEKPLAQIIGESFDFVGNMTLNIVNQG